MRWVLQTPRIWEQETTQPNQPKQTKISPDRDLSFMGSNPVSRTQPSVNERFSLLASTENGSRRCRRPCSFTDTRRRNWTQFRFPAPARFRKPTFSHTVAFKTLWLSNCFSE